MTISPDHQKVAFGIDTNGSERFTIKVKDLASGEILSDEIPDAAASLEWSADGNHLFYTTLDSAMRPDRVYRHALGSQSETDALLFEEPDGRFHVRVNKTRSGDFLAISSTSQVTSEWQVVDAHDPTAKPQVVVPRQQGIQYHLAHHGDHFYLVTNDRAIDRRLVKTPVANPGQLTEVIEAREG